MLVDHHRVALGVCKGEVVGYFAQTPVSAELDESISELDLVRPSLARFRA